MGTLRNTFAELLVSRGIRPTSNRVLIISTMAEKYHPISMSELEDATVTIDKSVLSRTLALFREKGVVHAIEGNGGIVLYELCRGKDGHRSGDEEHVHFFCSRCHRTLCLADTPIPVIPLPDGYMKLSVSCLVVGVCPVCTQVQSTSTRRQPS